MGRPRKFQIGDTAKVTKEGRYKKLLGLTGEIITYHIRIAHGSTYGSSYMLRFPIIGFRWVETEYLTKVVF